MLTYAILFLVVALIAAALGFEGIAGIALSAARIFFFIFIVLFVVALLVGLSRGF